MKQLEKYEEICPVCNGLGIVQSSYFMPIVYASKRCKICKGRGKIDWIDKLRKEV